MKTLTLILPLLLGTAPLGANSRDFHVWARNTIAKEIDKNWSALWEMEFRWEDNASQLTFLYSEFKLKWRPSESWIIAPAYRQVRKQTRINNLWRNEAEPYLDIIKKWKYADYGISMRNRFLWKSLDEEWFWRHRLKILTPWKLTLLELIPFLTNEFFFESGKRYVENRLEGGVELPIRSYLKGSLAYMLRYKKSGSQWEGFDTFITHLNWHF